MREHEQLCDILLKISDKSTHRELPLTISTTSYRLLWG